MISECKTVPQRGCPRADEAVRADQSDGCAQGRESHCEYRDGEASQNVKLLDVAVAELGQITGQKPIVTRAKKSIANFKIAAACRSAAASLCVATGCTNFLDRLCNVVLPRVRDFRGLPAQRV